MTTPGWQRALVSPWLLTAVALLAFFWQLGDVPLYDLDEGAFSEATREMLASGNFVSTYKDGEPRYDKPILIYWLQAASVSLLGLNELALRLPSALAATLWTLAIFRFGRRWLDRDSGAVAALVMANALMVGIVAKAATADALLNLLLALACFEIYAYFRAPERGPLLRAYLWMGLGMLTKGPVAVFFPLLASGLFFASERSFRAWLGAVLDPLGWALFLAVVLPWYVAIYLDQGMAFFESFFLRHNLGRFTGTMHGHRGFPGYYLVVAPLILLPFSGWMLRILPLLRAGWKDPLDRYLWIWFLSVLVFFSFSHTQLPHYLLYGATPLFLLMAKYRQRLVSRWLAFLPALLFLLLLLALPEIVAMAREQAHRLYELSLFQEGMKVLDGGYRLEVLAGIALLAVLAFWRGLKPWQGLVLAGMVQTAVVSGALLPRVFQVLQAPVKEAAGVARSLGSPTVVYHTSMPSFSVYRRAITPERTPRAGELAFVRVDKLERLRAELPNMKQQVVFRRGGVALVRVMQGARDGK